MFRKFIKINNYKSFRYYSSENAQKAFITCKRTEFNQYNKPSIGNGNNNSSTEIKFGKIPLASNGWYNRKSRGDYFIIHPTVDERQCLINTNIKELKAFNLNEQLLENLSKHFQINKPSSIQSEAIPEILFGSHCLIAAETGCGKTLAYLLPLIQKCLTERLSIGERRFNTPLVIVLTPGRELATQIGNLAEKLCENLNVRVKILLGGNTKQLMTNPTFDDVDILIGTMGATSKLVTTGIYRMHEVRHVVLDEADTLLDDSFNEKLEYFLKRFPFYRNEIQDINSKIVATQLIMVSATMPINTEDLLQTIIDPSSVVNVVGSDLHRILSNLPQRFLKMNKSERPIHLLKSLKTDLAERRPTIVFANKGATCDYLSIMLNESNIENVCLNANMPWKLRVGQFEKFQRGEVNILTSTDIGSRGLDTTRAMHVINYDFPLHIADYIHRIGRVGRVGSRNGCMATNFVSSVREIDVVQHIEHTARTQSVLPNVNGNITGVINERIVKKTDKGDRALFNSG